MTDPRAFFLHLLSKYAPIAEHPLLVVRAVEEVLWEGSFNDEEKVTIAQWVIGQFTEDGGTYSQSQQKPKGKEA